MTSNTKFDSLKITSPKEALTGSGTDIGTIILGSFSDAEAAKIINNPRYDPNVAVAAGKDNGKVAKGTVIFNTTKNALSVYGDGSVAPAGNVVSTADPANVKGGTIVSFANANDPFTVTADPNAPVVTSVQPKPILQNAYNASYKISTVKDKKKLKDFATYGTVSNFSWLQFGRDEDGLDSAGVMLLDTKRFGAIVHQEAHSVAMVLTGGAENWSPSTSKYAALEINCAWGCFMNSRITTNELNTWTLGTQDAGLQFFNSNTKKLNIYDGTKLVEIGSGGVSVKGNATLSGVTGTTVPCPSVLLTSVVLVTANHGASAPIDQSKIGSLRVGNIISGVSFTVYSTVSSDVSDFSWAVI